jgi:nitric oxide dioxygenase
MGLPKQMSETTISRIKATAPVVASRALDITKCFYKNLLGENPSLFSVFNRANMKSGRQPQALADIVVAYASHIDTLNALVGFTGSPVDRITHKHCGLDITPDQYLLVHKYLMGAIGETLGDAVTPDVAEAWNEAVLFLAKVCIDAEESLKAAAKSRSGGWAGFQAAEVLNVETLTDDIKRFTFKPAGSHGAAIDFAPGQFLSIRVDPNGDGLTAPRHYTLTNAPGSTTLQCAVKRVEGGAVSTFLHDRLAVGSAVEITPPFGCFVPRESSSKVVLLSGGIGVTPMLNFAESFGPDKVALVAHVDTSPAAHAFGADFASYPTLFKAGPHWFMPPTTSTPTLRNTCCENAEPT